MTQKEQKDWTENVRWAGNRQALLDDFAKAAMQGIMGSDNLLREAVKDSREQGLSHVDFVAQCAYDIAQAMMQERERRMKG